MGRLDKIRQVWTDEKLMTLKGVPQDVQADVVFGAVVQADPTHGKMVSWLLQAWAEGSLLWEDIRQGASSKTAETMSDFHKHKAKLPPQMRSLFKYETPGEVWEAVSAYLDDNAPSSKEEKRIQKNRAYFESYQETLPSGLKAVIPYTKFSSCFWGAGTRWCTAARRNNSFSNYMEKTPLCIFLLPSGNKYQACLDEYEFLTFLNAADDELDRDNRIELVPYQGEIAEFLWKVCRSGESRLWRGYLKSGNPWEHKEFTQEVVQYIMPSRAASADGVVAVHRKAIDPYLEWKEDLLSGLSKSDMKPSKIDGNTYFYDASAIANFLMSEDREHLASALFIMVTFKYDGTPESFVDAVWDLYDTEKLSLNNILTRMMSVSFDNCQELMTALYLRIVNTFSRSDMLSKARLWQCPDIGLIAKAYVDKKMHGFFQDAHLYKNGELKISPDIDTPNFQAFVTLVEREVHWKSIFDYLDLFEHTYRMTVFEYKQAKTIKNSVHLLESFRHIIPKEHHNEFFVMAMKRYQIAYSETIPLDTLRDKAPFLDINEIVKDVLSGSQQEKWKHTLFELLRDNCDYELSDWSPEARGYSMICGDNRIQGSAYYMLREISSSIGFDATHTRIADITTWIKEGAIIQKGKHAIGDAIIRELIPAVGNVPASLLTSKQAKRKLRLLQHLRATAELLKLSRTINLN